LADDIQPMRRAPLHLLLSRLLLALALIAPHGARAEAAAGPGLTLVICGSAGSYEITLGGDAPVHAATHDCCLSCAPAAQPSGGALRHAAPLLGERTFPAAEAPRRAAEHPAGRPRDPPSLV
jgi:hypothetical protein